MRLLVCGGRDFGKKTAERSMLYAKLDQLQPSVVIHGGASGADSVAEYWAVQRGVRFIRYPADWGLHGRVAGPMRNDRMLREGRPDAVLAAPGGRGTADMVRRAKAAGVPVHSLVCDLCGGEPTQGTCFRDDCSHTRATDPSGASNE